MYKKYFQLSIDQLKIILYFKLNIIFQNNIFKNFNFFLLYNVKNCNFK